MKKCLLLGLCGIITSGLVQADELVDKKIKSLEEQIKVLKKDIKKLDQNSTKQNIQESFTKDVYLSDAVELYAHGPAVVTSPALGVRRSAEDASDLIINLSSINEDLKLLQLRQKMDNYARKINLPIPNRPIIALSGGAVGKFTATKNTVYNVASTKFDVDTAEFSIVGEASPWATGVLVVSYTGESKSSYSDNYEGKFGLDRGFVTIGQLEKCPIYLSFGKMYAPFGSYSSHMLTDTSVKILGKVHDNMVILGFANHGLELQGFILSGGVKSESRNNLWKHFGANLAYNMEINGLKVMLGTSVLGDLAEAKKFPYDTLTKNGSSKLRKTPSGLNARMKIVYQNFSLSSEYVTSLGSLDAESASYKPRAFNVEGAVDFRLFNSSNSFAIGYGNSKGACFYHTCFPEHTIFTEYNVSLIKNTILGCEYRYDLVIPGDASGGSRKSQNTFTVKLGVFF